MDYIDRYKAGDFTSGKMGEIFKNCFMDSRTVVINHKVFGDCYMIPEGDIKRVSNFVLSSFLGLIVQRCADGRMIPVDTSDTDDHTTLELMKDNPYSELACKKILEDFEGVATEHDYFSVLEKITDLLYMMDIGEHKNSQ
jgi:hypothetical protein